MKLATTANLTFICTNIHNPIFDVKFQMHLFSQMSNIKFVLSRSRSRSYRVVVIQCHVICSYCIYRLIPVLPLLCCIPLCATNNVLKTIQNCKCIYGSILTFTLASSKLNEYLFFVKQTKRMKNDFMSNKALIAHRINVLPSG